LFNIYQFFIDQSAQVKGNGNGSPDTNAEGEAERTVFETVRLASDGSTERLVRTAITRVHDPVHSRVRFVGTEVCGEYKPKIKFAFFFYRMNGAFSRSLPLVRMVAKVRPLTRREM